MEAGVFTYRLPGGLFDERGQLHDEVAVRPPTGRDEELLAAGAGSPAAAVSALLGRVVKRVGAITEVDEALAGRLLVADRQFLLLRLRELSYGPRVSGSCCCTFQDCGKRVSLSFSTADIPVKPLADKRPVYECTLPAGAGDPGQVRTLGLRLPNGDDQAALCQRLDAGDSAPEALRGLLQRLLVPTPTVDPVQLVAGLSPRDLLDLERFLADTAPAVDLQVRMPCPECHRDFTVELDLQDFFFGELVTSAEQLYRDVHYLAFHYHWAEQEILGFSKSKRDHYIRVLADELEALNASG